MNNKQLTLLLFQLAPILFFFVLLLIEQSILHSWAYSFLFIAVGSVLPPIVMGGVLFHFGETWKETLTIAFFTIVFQMEINNMVRNYYLGRVDRFSQAFGLIKFVRYMKTEE